MAVKVLRAILFSLLVVSPLAASDLPKNIKLEIRMEETITSDTAETGQRFTATLNKAVTAGQGVVLEKGATVEGLIKLAQPTYNYQQPGELDLELVSIRSRGKLYLLKTNMLLLAGKPTATDPRTGRPMDPSSRKGDLARATIGTIPGAADPGGVSTTIPGTDVSVGSGGPGNRSMQVVVASGSKLTFNLTSASASDNRQ